MAREKKPVHKVRMTEGKRNIIHQLLEEYDIQTAEDIQEALKDLLGGTINEMMEAEMDDHLGYEKSECSDSDDYRNGYKTKRVNSSYGSMEIEVPQDRKAFATDLKTIYHAATEEQACTALDRVNDKWTPKYPNPIKRWYDNWDAALLKALYLATFEATKKWTVTIRNWGQVYGELCIMYEGRLPE